MAGWYEERVLSRVIERTLADPRIREWRAASAAEVHGEVVEFGFGSGPNLSLYGRDVRSVRVVEPVDSAWARAARRIEQFGRPVERIGLDGARVAAADASADTVVTTWTLCSIEDLDSALAEARRLLRPDGRLVFVEHALAPDAPVARWQRRIQPVYGLFAGTCRLDRDIPALLEKAGFDVEVAAAAYVLSGPAKVGGWFVRGSARPTDRAGGPS